MAKTVRDVTKQIRKDGWYLVAQRGSHRQYKHATRDGRVTIAGKPGDEIAPGTLRSILKQADLL
jgi:predicted RNA binding protein YcfA (HicA-like mRNA interferase family)